MVRIPRWAGALALATLSIPASAATDAELAEIRAQIRELRSQYEARLQALEARLKEAEARAVAPPAAAPPPAPAPVAAAAPGGNPSAFNPAISAILQGTYANLSRDPATYGIAGFAPRGEIAPPRRSFGLGESELVLSANVDPTFSGMLILSVTPEDTIAVEEAYGQINTAPYGLTPKFGRFLSGIGYLNEQHAHAWDFVDAPLAYSAFLGGRYSQDGVQVRWLAPTERYVELGGEVGNGAAYPGSDRSKNGVGSGAVFAHTGGDVGASHSWRAGLSYLDTDKSNVGIADFVWKYAPNGNSRERNFKLQGEYFTGRIDEAARQTGWYLQGVYQFHPEWRVGARYDRLSPGRVGLADDEAVFNPRRSSVMVDYNPSEFSRIRMQYARSETLPGAPDNQWFVQYILSLGAHGAHRY